MITPNTIWLICVFIVACITIKFMFNVGMVILFNLSCSQLLAYMEALEYGMDIKSLATSLLCCIFLFIMYLRGSYLSGKSERNNT